ncbi:DNA recombination protein RmuC, partial [uncultured Chryseobacterium sp.]
MITYLIIGCIAGGMIGAVIIYFALKSSTISRNSYDELNNLYIKNNSDLENAGLKIRELIRDIEKEKEHTLQQADLFNDLKNEFARISAEHASLQKQFSEQKELIARQNIQTENLLTEKQSLFAKNAELSAVNENLQKSLQTQKEEIAKIQEDSKLQFENLANKILEEKTEKFTTLNQNNLKNILEPFQERIVELKNRVNEAYEKENKERFSLAEKVKELAELNQQISEDAKKLTRALKGESKTQGN